MSDDTPEIVPSSREVIGSKSLPTTEDGGNVAVVLSQDDLCMIQHALGLAPLEWGEKRLELMRGLRKVKEAAFGI